jgi:hypothetical protein
MKTLDYLNSLTEEQREDLFKRLCNKSLTLFIGIIVYYKMGDVNHGISARSSVIYK